MIELSAEEREDLTRWSRSRIQFYINMFFMTQ